MKSELSFLMDLFLNDELPAPIKKLVSSRIREVEKELTQSPVSRVTTATSGFLQLGNPTIPAASDVTIATQSPSMQKIIERNQDLIPRPPQPVTAAAAKALQERQKLLNGAGKEKPEDGRTGPRKI